MFQALIAIVYRDLSSGHRDRTSVAAGITIVDFQKRPCQQQMDLNLRESGVRFPCKWSSVLEILQCFHLKGFHLRQQLRQQRDGLLPLLARVEHVDVVQCGFQLLQFGVHRRDLLVLLY